MAGKTQTKTGAERVKWDLGDLYESPVDPAVQRDMRRSLKGARKFEKQYRGKINTPGLTAPRLLAALREVETIHETLGKLISYAHLLFASDTSDPATGAFLQTIQQGLTEVRKHLIFFELELVQMPDEKAKKLASHKTLARYRHYIETERTFSPHTLTELEEKLNDERSNTGVRAFRRLFDEVINNIDFKVRLDGRTESMSESEALSLLYHPERKTRKAAAKGVTSALRGSGHILTYIFNTLVLDHSVTDRLRSYEHPMASRHLSNEISHETVNSLLSTTEAAYPTVQRYYALKRRLLGLSKLYDYDRYAPIFPDTRTITFTSARKTVLESFDAFSPRMGGVAARFFDDKWIDAGLRPGKRGGAFSHSTVPSVHPYVFMNYTGRLRDVMTLAHELGHGVHQYLARGAGYFQSNTPLTTAETASVFAEMIVFHRLVESERDPTTRLALICSKLEDIFATVFRQVVMTRFEQKLHTARREAGELTPERIGELWMGANEPMFGPSLELTDDYSIWWMYIPHFIHSPFYCYAYSFGELLVFALYNMYEREGQGFVPRYMRLLAAGGSDSPEELLKRVGVDITDPGFWQGGLDLIAAMVDEAEGLAGELG